MTQRWSFYNDNYVQYMVLCLYISFTGCYTSMYNWVWDHLIVRITHLYQLYYMAVCYLRNLWQRSRLRLTLRSRSHLFYSVPDRTKIILIQNSMRFVVVVDRWILQKTLWSKNILFETKRNIENANLVFFLFFWTMMMANFFMWLKLRLHMPSTSPFCERHLWSSWRYV